MSDLKPCPFCGFEASLKRDDEITPGQDIFWVECENEESCGATSGMFYDEKTATEAWDTRTGSNDD